MEDYTNRELGIILEELKEYTLEIKKQVITTNGRVKNLELWRMFLIGAWAVLSLITPVAWYFIAQSLSGFTNDVDAKIVRAINENNNKFFEYDNTQNRN